MNKSIKNILTIVISLGLGVFLIWLVVSKFTDEDIAQMKKNILGANYYWLLLSVLLGVFSHISRAMRWRLTLEPLGYKTKFMNRWFTVMIGYLVNLAIPRMGEVSRCAFLSKYENDVPFEKAFGTLIAERIIDLLMLILLIVIYIVSQYDVVFGFLSNIVSDKLPPINTSLIVIVSAIFLAIVTGLFFFVKNSKIPFIVKIREFIIGIIQGIMSITKIKGKFEFLFHTIFIWSMYVMMFYVCIFALPETSNIPFMGTIGAFVLGGISMIATQGGLGAYPLAIQQILILYGITSTTGYAFGWIVWLAQTTMVLVLGFLSVILISLFNKKKEQTV